MKSVNTQKEILKIRSRIALNKWAGIRLNVNVIQGLLKFKPKRSNKTVTVNRPTRSDDGRAEREANDTGNERSILQAAGKEARKNRLEQHEKHKGIQRIQIVA